MSTKGIAEAFEKAVAGKNDLPITAGISRWKSKGRPITREAMARVHEIMMADLGNSRADGSGRIRPSSIGNECTRFQMLSYLGFPKTDPPEDNLDLMEVGTWAHYRWQARGLSEGFLTEIEPKVGDPRWRMAGAMDGTVDDGSGFELKNTAEHIYRGVMRDNVPKWPHLMQVGAYMLAKSIDKFSIVYENRARPAMWHEFRVAMSTELEWALGLLRKRVVDSINTKTLPEMHTDCMTGGPKNDFARFNQCEFTDVCPGAKWRELKNV